MRSVTVLTAALLACSLVACSNGYDVPQTSSNSADVSSSRASVAPVELRSSEILARIHTAPGHARPDAVTPGIYTSVRISSDSASIYAYPDPDASNGPPVCSVGPIQNLSGVDADRNGDLLVGAGVDYHNSTVTIFKGPGLCGPKLGSVVDPYGGPPYSVASRDAQTGKIVVGNDSSHNGHGSRRGGVTVCTLSGGCTVHFNAPRLVNVFSVAIAPNGDCWATGWDGEGTSLAYFAQCRHTGVIATGFTTSQYNWLDIDGKGNLVTIGQHPSSSPGFFVWIYSGCNPACSLVGGPFRVTGGVGHLDAKSKRLVVNAWEKHRLDVYAYSTSGLKHKYSISNGLASIFIGAAFSPSSKE